MTDPVEDHLQQQVGGHRRVALEPRNALRRFAPAALVVDTVVEGRHAVARVESADRRPGTTLTQGVLTRLSFDPHVLMITGFHGCHRGDAPIGPWTTAQTLALMDGSPDVENGGQPGVPDNDAT